MDEANGIVAEARYDMHVEMEHRLFGSSAVVGKYIKRVRLECLDQCAGDELCRIHDVMQVSRGECQQVRTMVLWDDKSMTMMDWVDV